MDDGRALPPETIQFRRWSGGVEIALLKPPLALKSRKHLWGAIGGSVAIVFLTTVPTIAFSLFHPDPGMTVLLPIFGVAIGAVCISSAINWNRESAVLEVRDGVRSSGDRRQWQVADVAGVQAIRAAGPWALRITPKYLEPYIAFKGRSRIEVLCAKCRPPHHEECWLFNGACSTYACKEIRFTRSA